MQSSHKCYTGPYFVRLLVCLTWAGFSMCGGGGGGGVGGGGGQALCGRPFFSKDSHLLFVTYGTSIEKAR